MQVGALLIIFQLSKSKELSLKLVDDFEEKCRMEIITSLLEFRLRKFDEGRIRLCYSCALIMSRGVSLTCTDFKTCLKHAQQERQRVFTACRFSTFSHSHMRTKVNVLRMHTVLILDALPSGQATSVYVAATKRYSGIPLNGHPSTS